MLGGPGVISHQFSENPKSPWEGEVPDEPNEAGAVQAFGSEGPPGCRFGARLAVLSHSKTRSSTVNSTLVAGRFGGVEIGDLPGWQMSASSLRHSKVKVTVHGSELTGSSVFAPQRSVLSFRRSLAIPTRAEHVRANGKLPSFANSLSSPPAKPHKAGAHMISR